MAQCNTTFNCVPQGVQRSHAVWNRQVYERLAETTTARLHTAT